MSCAPDPVIDLIKEQSANALEILFDEIGTEPSTVCLYAAGFVHAITLAQSSSNQPQAGLKPRPHRARHISNSSTDFNSSSSPYPGPSSDLIGGSSPASSIAARGPNQLAEQHWKSIIDELGRRDTNTFDLKLGKLPDPGRYSPVMDWLALAFRLRKFERHCNICDRTTPLSSLTCNRCVECKALEVQDDLDDARDEAAGEVAADHEMELAAVQDDCEEWRLKAFAAEAKYEAMEEEAEDAEERAQRWWSEMEDKDDEIEQLEAKVKRLEEALADAEAEIDYAAHEMAGLEDEEEDTAIETEEEPTEMEDNDSSDGAIPFHYDRDVRANAPNHLRHRPAKRVRRAPPPADPTLSMEPLVPRRLFSSFLPPNAHAAHRRAPLGRAPLREVVASTTGEPPYWLHARKTHFGLEREESEAPSEAGTEGSEEVAEIFVQSEDDGYREGGEAEVRNVLESLASPPGWNGAKGKSRAREDEGPVVGRGKPGRGYNQRQAKEQLQRGLKRTASFSG